MKTESCLISVILPVYNRQDVLEECIRSVQAQSRQDWEVVIVDDGSGDDTYQICAGLAEEDARIRLFAADHGGVSAARNRALREAKGKYVFFLDSDDVIAPPLLETLVTAMESTGAAMGGTDVARARQENWHRVRERLAKPYEPGETRYLTHEEALDAMFRGGSPFSCIGGVMMRRDLVGGTEFNTDIYIGEDYLFIYENLIKGASAVFLKQKWYYVRNHAENSSWDWSFAGFRTRFDRRRLVWERELAQGRPQYADIQKREGFGCFETCIRKNPPHSADAKQMRALLKTYRREVYPALGGRGKVKYWLYMLCPGLTAKLLEAFRKKKSV